MILVEVISAIAIFVFITLFFLALKIKEDGIKADISAKVQSKALDDALLTYLRTPAGPGQETYGDMAIRLMESGQIKTLDTLYFDRLAGRTGICFEFISFYKGSVKQATLQPDSCRQEYSDGHTPVYRPVRNYDEAWALLSSTDGTLYMVLANGYKVGE